MAFVISVSALGIELPKPKINPNTNSQIFWITDDKILVRSAEDVALLVVNVASGEVHEHARIDRFGAVCFNAGTVLYKKGDKFWFGDFGKEKEDSEVSEGISKGGVHWGRCRHVDVSTYPPWPSKVVPLLEQHGAVELRYRFNSKGQIFGSDAELYLWKPGARSPVLIPGFTAADATSFANGGVNYFPFKKAYFVVGGARSWWLYPDGQAELVQVPKDFSEAPARVSRTPVKTGMLMGVHPYIVPGRPTVSEVYFFPTNGAKEFIYRGTTLAPPIVSPNGCKAALAGRRRVDADDPFLIYVFDVCVTN